MNREVNIRQAVQQISYYYLISSSDDQNRLNDSITDIKILQELLGEIRDDYDAIFSQYNLRSKRQNILNRHIVDDFKRLSKILGFKLFLTSVPKNSDIAHASANYQNIFQYKSKSPAAKIYKQLIEEILNFVNIGCE